MVAALLRSLPSGFLVLETALPISVSFELLSERVWGEEFCPYQKEKAQ
jgi:hypothetical protein